LSSRAPERVDCDTTPATAVWGEGLDDRLDASAVTGTSLLLDGGAGGDYLLDGAGNDTINGGPGGDVGIAGPGSDVYNGGDGDDSVTRPNEIGRVVRLKGQEGRHQAGRAVPPRRLDDAGEVLMISSA
jgi:Ca2+-binding RTX toxin-like protein